MERAIDGAAAGPVDDRVHPTKVDIAGVDDIGLFQVDDEIRTTVGVLHSLEGDSLVLGHKRH